MIGITRRIGRRAKRDIQRLMCRYRLELNPRVKVFGIGRNKTGTTSLQQALTEQGYRVAPTSRGEMLLPAWINRDYQPITSFCRDYDAFQDIPFSLPGCYEALDEAFPNSKFILTVRDSEDQWYQSLTKFHAKKFGNGRLPTWDDLQASNYRYPGFIADCQRHVYHAESIGLYDERGYKQHYRDYNDSVRAYFRDRPGDFLELNVGETGAYRSLCQFLGFPSNEHDFPWANRTAETQ